MRYCTMTRPNPNLNPIPDPRCLITQLDNSKSTSWKDDGANHVRVMVSPGFANAHTSRERISLA